MSFAGKPRTLSLSYKKPYSTKNQNIPPIAKEHQTVDGKNRAPLVMPEIFETGIKTTFWASHFKTRLENGTCYPVVSSILSKILRLKGHPKCSPSNLNQTCAHTAIDF